MFGRLSWIGGSSTLLCGKRARRLFRRADRVEGQAADCKENKKRAFNCKY